MSEDQCLLWMRAAITLAGTESGYNALVEVYGAESPQAKVARRLLREAANEVRRLMKHDRNANALAQARTANTDEEG